MTMFAGPVPESHWEEWLPSAALGSVHHTGRQLRAALG